VVVPETNTNGFLSHAVSAQKLEGVARGAKRLGYDLQIFIENLEDAAALRRLAVEKSVRAFCFLGVISSHVLQYLNQYGIPWVILNWHHPERPQDPHVWTDFAHSGRTLCGHLLGLGCKRVLAFDWLTPDYGPFAQGVRDAWNAAGLPAQDLLLFTGKEYDRGPTVQAKLNEALDAARPPDGILLSHEEGVADAYRVLRARGLMPGRVLPVVTFDDLGLARNFDPPCTCYRQPFYEMGTLAVEELDRVMAGKGERRIARNVPGELVIRESTRDFRKH